MQAPRLAQLSGKSASHALARAKANTDQTCQRMARRPRVSSTVTQLSDDSVKNGSSNSAGRAPGGHPCLRQAKIRSCGVGGGGSNNNLLIAFIIAFVSLQ